MEQKIINIISNNGIKDFKIKFKNKFNPKSKLEENLKNYHPLTKISCLSIKSKNKNLPEFKYDNVNFVGYIKFHPFEKELNKFDDIDKKKIVELVKYKLKLWLKKHLNGLIIDIRGFYGWEIIIIESLNEFLGNVTLYGLTDNDKISYSQPIWINYKFNQIRNFPEVFYNSKFLNNNLYFLIDETTKKEGEIIALIFKHRSTLIGNKTKGELFYSECFYLNQEKTLSLITKYYVDITRKIYHEGYVKPDINCDNKNILKIVYKKILNNNNNKND
jgi:C-terminal processing protease CtpA/Prc